MIRTTKSDEKGDEKVPGTFSFPLTASFTTLDSFAGINQDPQSLHKYLYSHGDGINFNDPTGMFDVSIGGLSVTISASSIGYAAGAGAAISAGFNTLTNFALDRPLTENLAGSLVVGAFAGPGVVAFPALGVGLGVAAIVSSTTIVYTVHSNPNSTGWQVGASYLLLGGSLFGTGMAIRYAATAPWTNANALVSVAPRMTAQIRAAFSEVTGPNKALGGFITPTGDPIFVEFTPGRVSGHTGAVQAGLAPRGSLGFSVLTDSQGRVTTLFLKSGLNPRSQDYGLPPEIVRAILDGLPLEENTAVVD